MQMGSQNINTELKNNYNRIWYYIEYTLNIRLQHKNVLFYLQNCPEFVFFGIIIQLNIFILVLCGFFAQFKVSDQNHPPPTQTLIPEGIVLGS